MAAEARWALVVAGYFGIQLVLRLAIGPALELDEAEAFLHARHLAWGYGPQPPLYFWMQWGLFQVLGEGLIALAALKAILLAGSLIVLQRLLAWDMPANAAVVGALALGLLPQVSWEGQRALTHSVLALALAVVVAHAFVRALDRGRWRDYAWLGAATGLGLLSKFNFAVWPVALVGAALLLPEWRRDLRWRGLGLAVGATLAVVAPAAAWIVRHLGLATGSAGKLDLAPDGTQARIEGTLALAGAALGFLALVALVLGVARIAGRGTARAAGDTPVVRLLVVASLVGLALVWVGVLASGATSVRERWLLPFAWALAPAGAAALWPRLGPSARRWLAAAVVVPWLLAMAGLPYASLIDPGYRGADFAPVVAAARAAGAPALPVVATDQWVAGNIAFAAPDLAVIWRADGAGPRPAVLAAASGHPAAPGDALGVTVATARRDLRLVVGQVAPEAP